MEKIISTNNMDKNALKKQSKSKLINLLLQQKKQMKLLFQKIKLLSQQNVKQHFKNDNDYKPRKPIPTPRKSVKQMAQEYEDNIIAQFRYIKIQPKTIDLSTRLVGINPTNSVVIPMSLVLSF